MTANRKQQGEEESQPIIFVPRVNCLAFGSHVNDKRYHMRETKLDHSWDAYARWYKRRNFTACLHWKCFRWHEIIAIASWRSKCINSHDVWDDASVRANRLCWWRESNWNNFVYIVVAFHRSPSSMTLMFWCVWYRNVNGERKCNWIQSTAYEATRVRLGKVSRTCDFLYFFLTFSVM